MQVSTNSERERRELPLGLNLRLCLLPGLMLRAWLASVGSAEVMSPIRLALAEPSRKVNIEVVPPIKGFQPLIVVFAPAEIPSYNLAQDVAQFWCGDAQYRGRTIPAVIR